MASVLKQVVGRILFETCERIPRMKPPLQNWGLRAPRSYPCEVVHVQLPEKKTIALGSFNQNYLSFQLFWKGVGYYEPISTLVARELVRGAGTFLDVGANIGFYTMVLSALEQDLRVISFEPNPKNFALLCKNVALNGFPHATCEPVAVSDQDGATDLYLSASDMSASLESAFEGSTTSIKVPRVRLDSYLAAHETPGPLVIKVDVEGHEAAFFRGAERTLLMRRPDIICEVTTMLDASTCALLKDAGYRPYKITDRGLEPSEDLRLVVRDGLVFLNYLLSPRPPQQVAGLFDRIADQVKRIDLRRTSKAVQPELLAEMLSRSMLQEGQQDAAAVSAQASNC